MIKVIKLLLTSFVLLAVIISLAKLQHPKQVSAQTTSPLSNIHHVWVIIEENHNWSQITSSAMPNLYANILPIASHANNYHNVPTALGALHPSEPNYMWLEGATNIYPDHTFTTDNNASSSNDTTSTGHLATILSQAGVSWRAYQEDMPTGVCPINSSGNYAAKHNPFVFYTDVSGNPPSTSYYAGTPCSNIIPSTQLQTDLQNGTVASYNFITPNLQNDMHDGTTQQADTWLWNTSGTGVVQEIMNSQAYKQDGAIFITWDEGGTSTSCSPYPNGNCPIGMIVISPYAKINYTNTIEYSHASFVKTVAEIFGVAITSSNFNPTGYNNVTAATDLSDFFGTSNATPTPTKAPTPTFTPTLSPTPTPTKAPPPTPTPGATSTPTPTPSQCPPAPTNTGTVTSSFNISTAGNYIIWSRIMSAGDGANSYYLQIDNSCIVNVGDLNGMPSNQWIWINYQNGNQANITQMNLTSGSHTVKLIGREANTRVDRVIFTTDSTCIPSNTGDNCLAAVATPTFTPTPLPTNTPTPIPTITATPTPTGSNSISLTPTDDSYVDNSLPSNNYGTSNNLQVDSSPAIQRSFMKFDLSSLSAATINSAVLHLYVSNYSAGPDTVELSGTNWTESTITYNTQPSVGNTIATFNGGSVGQTLNIDITSVVQSNVGGSLSLAIDTTNADGIFFNSKDASANHPSLDITYSSPTATPTFTPTPTPKPTNTPTPTPTPYVDTQAPTTPTNLTATTVSSTQINLTWTSSTDNIGVVGYQVFRDGTLITTVSNTTFGDSTLSPSTTYSYYVKAYDAAGNISTASNTASATTANPPATIGTIQGTVTSSATSAPIVGAQVLIVVNHSKQYYSTDSNGNYLITNLPFNTYSIKYSATSFSNQTLTVTVTSSNPMVTENVALNPNNSKKH